jgi:hypothetical protein
VRGDSDSGLVTILLLVSAGLLVVGFHDRHVQPWSRTPPYFWAASGVVAVLGVAAMAWLLQRRRWIEPTPEGFALMERGRRVTFHESCVVGITRWHPWTPSDSARYRVRLAIKVGENPRRVECSYSAPRSEIDPLAPLWSRLIEGLARRTRAGLDGGAVLTGKGWRLDQDGLHHGASVIPLSRVTKAAYFDRRLCVWKDEDERPSARFRASSRNVQPLGVLLWEASGGAEGNRPLPASPLGRVLIDRRAYDGVLGLAIVLGLTLSCGVYLPRQLPAPWSDLISGAGVLVSLLLLGFGISQIRTELMPRLIFHEKGVTWPTPKGVETLLFAEVGKVVWVANGAVLIRLARDGAKPAFNFHAALVRSPEDLAVMRDLLCLTIARRWAKEVPLGPVKWTSRLRFLPGGLEYTRRGLLVKPHPFTVPYHLTSYRIENGVFKLFVVGEVGPVFKEATSGENFYAGLMLLHLIYDGAESVILPPD